MNRVILESPFSGDVERNIRYARACVRDCLIRGESPIASHLLFTQEGILRDENPIERELGIRAGLAWATRCDYPVFYTDLGWSFGMKSAALYYQSLDMGYEIRTLGGEWLQSGALLKPLGSGVEDAGGDLAPPASKSAPPSPTRVGLFSWVRDGAASLAASVVTAWRWLVTTSGLAEAPKESPSTQSKDSSTNWMGSTLSPRSRRLANSRLRLRFAGHLR